MEILDRIVNTFRRRGNEIYAGEDVTQLQHATQCARLATLENATDSLVVAALLHDIGHIVGEHELPADCRDNLDDQHEEAGNEFLREHFGEEVVAPVRLHVAAKRYLCTTNEQYVNQLSPISLKSLADQGGLMTADQVSAFEKNPHFHDAVRLRHWDDRAKDADLPQQSIDEYIPILQRVLTARTTTASESTGVS